MKRMKINLKFIFIFLLILIYLIQGIQYLLYIPNKLDYFDAELLINYSAGFIRRGLLGEIFIWLHEITGMNLLAITKYFSIITYALLIAYFIYNFTKKNISLFFLLLPSGLFFLLLDNRIRLKDSLLLLLIIVCCKIIKLAKNNIFTKLLLLSLVLSVGILLHEMIFFYTVPFLLIYLYSIKKTPLKNVWNFLFIIPVLTFLIVIFSHGFVGAGDIIFENIKSYLPENSYTKDLPTPLFYINSSAKNIIFINFSAYSQGFSRGILYLQYLASLIFVIIRYNDFRNINVFIFKKDNGSLSSSFLATTFLLQLFCAIPLYFIAMDWQRFIFFALISSFIYTYELGGEIGYIKKFHFKMDSFIAKYIAPRNEALTIFVSTVLFVPHLKLGNIDYLFTNGYLMIFNYATKILFSITTL